MCTLGTCNCLMAEGFRLSVTDMAMRMLSLYPHLNPENNAHQPELIAKYREVSMHEFRKATGKDPSEFMKRPEITCCWKLIRNEMIRLNREASSSYAIAAE